MTGTPTWRLPVGDVIAGGVGPTGDLIDELVGSAADRLGSEGARQEAERVRHRLLGFGPLSEVVAIAGVTDVLVNGDGAVWIDRGQGAYRVGSVDPGDVRALAVRLAGQAGRRLDDAQPWADGLLPGGVRLHAILPPVATSGCHLSLRLPRVNPAGVAGLREIRAVDDHCAGVLRAVVQGRLSFLVTGGTGAGKTTVLAGLLGECPPGERIVVVEDVAELAPAHPHVVSLQCRPPNVEGAGALTMTDLVRQALRMRPDRLVVGEVRGAEVRELLLALNTGHEGGASTMHANGAAEVPARCEALGSLAGMPRESVHAQLREAVRVVVHTARRGQWRGVVAVALLQWSAGSVVSAEVLTRGGPHDPCRRGPAWAEFAELLHARGVSDLPWSG